MSLSGSFWRTDGDDLILSIRLTPRSVKDAVGGIWQDEKGALWLQVQVRAVPEKGKANDALVRLLAKQLAIPAKDIMLAAGETSRMKRLRVIGRAHQAHQMIRERIEDDHRQAD